MLKKKDFVTAIRLFELIKVEFASDPLFSSAQSNDVDDADDDAESIQNKIDVVIGQLKSVFFGKYKWHQKTDGYVVFKDQVSFMLGNCKKVCQSVLKCCDQFRVMRIEEHSLGSLMNF